MDSSNLAAVGYDPASGEIRVLFTEAPPTDTACPTTSIHGLMSAPSKGRYFNRYIRWRYRGRRI